MKEYKLTCTGYEYDYGRGSRAEEFKNEIKVLREQGITYGGIANVIRLDYGVELTERLINQFVRRHFLTELVA